MENNRKTVVNVLVHHAEDSEPVQMYFRFESDDELCALAQARDFIEQEMRKEIQHRSWSIQDSVIAGAGFDRMAYVGRSYKEWDVDDIPF